MIKYIILGILVLIPIVLYIIQKSNLKYYTLNGRQPIEIEKWLKTRSWFTKFKNNVEQEFFANYLIENPNALVTPSSPSTLPLYILPPNEFILFISS